MGTNKVVSCASVSSTLLLCRSLNAPLIRETNRLSLKATNSSEIPRCSSIHHVAADADAAPKSALTPLDNETELIAFFLIFC